MASILNWQPESTLIEQILRLAQQRGQSPQTILTEAVRLYLDTQPTPAIPKDSFDVSDRQTDPLIGLFSGSPELSTQSETILEQEITPQSGWTWKSR
jgi:hypothetical protein